MNNTSIFQFKKYLVENIDFKIKNISTPQRLKFDFDINKEVEYNNNSMNLLVFVDVFKNEINAPFELSLAIRGFFEFSENIENKEIFEKNAMAILFPYIRNIITNITSISGFPPLIIPTLNINKFYENKGD
jgi:preprotein translocase subunit SecB